MTKTLTRHRNRKLVIRHHFQKHKTPDTPGPYDFIVHLGGMDVVEKLYKKYFGEEE
jgi:hypothetical protein